MTQNPPAADLDESAKAVFERLGGLVDEATATQIAEAVEESKTETSEPPECEMGCGGDSPATKLGVAVVNNRAYPNTPLCDDCYIPFEDIILPESVSREEFAKMHTDQPL